MPARPGHLPAQPLSAMSALPPDPPGEVPPPPGGAPLEEGDQCHSLLLSVKIDVVLLLQLRHLLLLQGGQREQEGGGEGGADLSLHLVEHEPGFLPACEGQQLQAEGRQRVELEAGADSDAATAPVCSGVALVDLLVEHGEDGVAVFEGAQEGGEGPEPPEVLLLGHPILQELCPREKESPQPLLVECRRSPG